MTTYTGRITYGTSLGTAGYYTHTDITVTLLPIPNGAISVVYLKSDCNGEYSLDIDDVNNLFYASIGKWIKQGSVYVLNAPTRRYSCCPAPGTSFLNGQFVHYQPPNNSGYRSIYLGGERTGLGAVTAGARAFAMIGGVPKACAGIGATIVDSCGRMVALTSRSDGTMLGPDGVGDFQIVAPGFDWTHITSVSVTGVPPIGNFTNVGTGGYPAYPSLGPELQGDGSYVYYNELCICSSAVFGIDVTSLLVAGGTDNSGDNPSNLHHPYLGHYGRFATTSSGIAFWRSDFATPSSPTSWAVNRVLVTQSGSDASPHGAYDRRIDRLHCVFIRAGAGTAAVSDDDGETWTEAGTAPGLYPRIVVDPYTGDMLRAGYAAGTLQGTFQAQGEVSASPFFTFKDSGGTNISVENDSFDIVKLPGNSGQWAAVWRVLGSGTCSLWLSADDTETWRKSYDCLTGCTHPRLEVDMYTGDLLITGYQSSALKGVFQAQGETAAGAVFDLGISSVQDKPFDVSKCANEAASRWVLTVMIGTDTSPSEYWSGDDGETWKKVS